MPTNNDDNQKCRKGHLLTPDNVYMHTSKGKTVRECKECTRTRERARYLQVNPNPKKQDKWLNTPRKKYEEHGLQGTKIYRAWLHMKDRCYAPRNINYENYGGRGITICERWLNSVEAFAEDVGPSPSPKHSIDRIDVYGNYEPNNVRWATATQQSLNRRTQLNKSSFYIGVHWSSRDKKWIAKIRYNNSVVELGNFNDEEQAGIAYDVAAIQIHGKEARSNFL